MEGMCDEKTPLNLIVDIGNTRAKFALMEGDEVVTHRCVESLRLSDIADLLGAWPAVTRAVVSSTRGDAEEVAEAIRTLGIDCLEFTPRTPVPIANAYHTPETLGRDRLAAAVGAAALFPHENLLIVDFGTALTVDLVTADATFRGGFISPGLRMRFRALHDYTAKLPLCSPTEERLPLGVTTESAITQGVMQGLLFEIEGHIARIGAEFAGLRTIFTGGDAKYFVKRIKNTIFADQNLVFHGLNRILEYNASEKNPD